MHNGPWILHLRSRGLRADPSASPETAQHRQEEQLQVPRLDERPVGKSGRGGRDPNPRRRGHLPVGDVRVRPEVLQAQQQSISHLLALALVNLLLFLSKKSLLRLFVSRKSDIVSIFGSAKKEKFCLSCVSKNSCCLYFCFFFENDFERMFFITWRVQQLHDNYVT